MYDAQSAACPSDSLLRIVAVTSANYERVFSYWDSSLKLLKYPREKLHIVDLGVLPPPYGYCTQSWRHAIDQQLAEVVAWIRGHLGEYFLHTDTDIQFFPRFLQVQADWLRWMRDWHLDMIFMRERTSIMPDVRMGEVNAGFYVVHCNERTLKLWEQVLADELAYPKMDGYPPYTDQYHLNRALNFRRGVFPQTGAHGVRWASIPDVHCIWSEPACEEELQCAAFHHAVNTRDKPRLLQTVRDRVLAVQALPAMPPEVIAFLERVRAIQTDVYDLSRAAPAAAPPPHLAGAASAALQSLCLEARRLVGSLAEEAAHCITCGTSPGCWTRLLWSAEDGRGHCGACWRLRYGTDPLRDAERPTCVKRPMQ